MTITKETAIELAKEAGFAWSERQVQEVEIEKLCNLAVAHEARDLALVQNLLSEYGLQALDVVEAFKAAKDVEPVAWYHLPWDNTRYMTKVSRRPQEDVVLFHPGEPLYLHPAPDDTALLRQALEYAKMMKLYGPAMGYGNTTLDEHITALRERLGEKA